MQHVYIVHVWFQHKAVGTHTPWIFWQNRSSELYLKLERTHFSSFTNLLHCHLMLLAESPYRLLLIATCRWPLALGPARSLGSLPESKFVSVETVARSGCPSGSSQPFGVASCVVALCQGRTNPTIRCRRLQCALFGVPWLKTTNVVKEHANEILVAKVFVGWPICCNYQSWTHFLPILRNCHPEMSIANWCRVMPSRMSIIVAVEMSSQPFKSFQFDGILGLGLPGLTMSRTVGTAPGSLVHLKTWCRLCT